MGSETLARAAAIIIGYLLGSIPTAYIVTRIALGQDIRKLGGGNVGSLNTLREVGILPAIIVAVADLGKGAAVVAIAYWILGLSPLFVMLAGLAAIIGHNWMVWIKFTGGKGMAAALGAVITTFLAYGHWQGMAVFLGIIAVPLFITQNVTFSMGIGLFSLPIITWLVTGSGLAVIMTAVMGLIIGLRFLSTAHAAWAKSHDKSGLIFDKLRPKKR